MNEAAPTLWAVRIGLIVAGLVGWFWTQRLTTRFSRLQVTAAGPGRPASGWPPGMGASNPVY